METAHFSVFSHLSAVPSPSFFLVTTPISNCLPLFLCKFSVFAKQEPVFTSRPLQAGQLCCVSLFLLRSPARP